MSKFNTAGSGRSRPARGKSVSSTEKVGVKTYEGALGVETDPKTSLFRLAVTFMSGDSAFYESEDIRYARLVNLVHRISGDEESVNTWILPFVKWLRSRDGAAQRTAAVAIASEFIRARSGTDGQGDGRALVGAACTRGDDPLEMVAYWNARYGGGLPRAMRMGIADWFRSKSHSSPYSYFKYGQGKKGGLGWGDLIKVSHPSPVDAEQRAFFGWVIGSEGATPPEMAQNRDNLMHIPEDRRREFLRSLDWQATAYSAGITWEWLSSWIPGGMDAEAWEKVIPSMGIFALARNLRNFDRAGISRQSRKFVEDVLTDRDAIRNSGIMPYQWYNAYRAVSDSGSVRWLAQLDDAVNISLENVPEFSGRTLILADMSGSMFTPVSRRSNIHMSTAAALFASAMKIRNGANAHLYTFGTWLSPRFETEPGASILTVTRAIERCMNGTALHDCVRQAWAYGDGAGYDRIVLLTDEQSFGLRAMDGDYFNEHRLTEHYDALPVPDGVPVYIWNFAGYRAGAVEPGRGRHIFGGFTDSSFKVIPTIESGRDGVWPWER